MYVKVGDRWRYVKPVVGKNNKLRPGYALIAGIERHVPNAAYYLRYREGSRIIWRKCSSAADATVARERQEAYFTAFVHGLTPKQQWDKNPPPATMSDVLLPWLEEYRLSHQPESHALMVQTLNEFNNWCLIEAIWQIRFGPSSGEDAAGGIWAERRKECKGAGEETSHRGFPRVYAHLRTQPEGEVHSPREDDRQTAPQGAEGGRRMVPEAPARACG